MCSTDRVYDIASDWQGEGERWREGEIIVCAGGLRRGGGEGGRMRRHVDTKNERKSLILMTLKSK